MNEGYVSCGIPYELFQAARPLLGDFAGLPALPGRTGHNALVPYNWTAHVSASGAEIVSLNCLECHAGSFDGELVIGLGRADVDYTQDLGQLFGGIAVPEIPIPGLDELTRFVQRYQVLGPQIVMYTVGTNPADEVAVILASHRDRDTLAWHDEEALPVPDLVAPVDTPPWWRTKKKNGLFYNGMARGDHRGTMMFASSLCTDSVDEAESILAYFNNVRAFIASIEAPAYPFAIDEQLAGEGLAVFAQNCAGCHGTYGASDDEDTYPNLIFDVDFVGTDPLVASFADASPLISWFNESTYGETTQLVTDDPLVGYTAPPLDGIWATAPFLHNGSVPTLALVLDSAARPEVWKRVDYDSTNFDEDALGWPFVEVGYSWDDAPEGERKLVYDTSKLGHWNTGHTFGDHLSEVERAAVLEYLKTL
jgi:mono/diheme cytochrome c family protein